MLYNNRRNRKINEKKVLHKVRKHWVTVSVALLSLIGAAGMAENNVHASSLNANHQNNNEVNNNVEHKTSTLVKPSNNTQQINPNQRSLNLGSADSGHQVQSIHQFNHDQLTKQTSVLRDRILSQLKTSQSQSPKQNSQQTASVSNSNNQSAQTSQNLSGYYGRSTNGSVSSNSISSSAPSASQASPKMAKVTAPQVGDDATDDAVAANSSALSDISDKFGQVSTLTNDVFNYIAQAKSASNVAAGQLSRYSNIDPKSVNTDFDPNGSNNDNNSYGIGSNFSFSDNSDSAENYANKLNIDLENMPSAGAIQDEIKAKFANSMANSLSDQILDSADNVKYQAKLASLANGVDIAYAQAQDLINSMSDMASDATTQASNVKSTFSSVASAADSAGAALQNNNVEVTGDGPATNTTYKVANVYTNLQFHNALEDPNVNKINVMHGISLWNIPYAIDDIPTRNLSVNGLTDQGTWNAVDFADMNYDVGPNGGVNNEGMPITLIQMENMNIYGVDYWGTISVNHSSVNAINDYKNINYVGAQLAYNEGNTKGVFEGKINIAAGTSYSPTGKYRKYRDFKVAGNLSPYPGVIKNGIDTSTINNAPITPSPDEYIGPDITDPQIGDLKHNTTISGWHSAFSGPDYLNGGAGPGDYQTPDLAVACSGGTGINTNNIENHTGLDIPCDQQILQISDGQPTIFKSNCQLNGSTTDGDCFTIDGSGHIYLSSGAQVNLTPRGNNAENTASGGVDELPSGINIHGDGTNPSGVHIGPGAELNITPKTDTDEYNKITYSNLPNYAPGAINVYAGGNIDVLSGGTLDVEYPQTKEEFGSYSIPDGTVPTTNSYSPAGAVFMGGTSAIHAEPYSSLIVNGGSPSDKSGNQGNLVYFASGGTNANSYVDAQSHSTVKLSSGGNQKIMLFYAPNGTYINVKNPQQFSLDLTHNTYNMGEINSNPSAYANDCSQLASDGVSIEGDQVTGYDQPNQDVNDPNYGKFDHSFGQYNELVLPGKQYQLPPYLLDEIEKIINKIEPIIKNTSANGGSVKGDEIWQNLGPVIWGTSNGEPCQGALDANNNRVTGNPPTDVGIGTSIIPTLMHNPENGFGHIKSYTPAGDDILQLTDQAHLIPFGVSSLTDADSKLNTYKFNNSIDLPYIITYSMIYYLKNKTGLSDINLDPHDEGVKVANEINGTGSGDLGIDNDYGTPKDTNMYYDEEQIPIHRHGFNITKGFAFKGVPQSYIEGVKFDPQTRIISGYSYPGSYIKIRENTDYNESDGTPDPNVKDLDVEKISDKDYDPSDPDPDDYVTTAKALGSVPSIGRWSYKLPAGITQDQINHLVVTSHTATVGNKDSARESNYYMQGRNKTLGKMDINTTPINKETPQPKDTTNIAPNGVGYAAYLSNDHNTLTVTGDFTHYGGNGIDGNNNRTNGLSSVENLNLGNAWNISNTSWMFNNMSNLYTINQIGNWNTNNMKWAIGTFDKDDKMNAQYLGPIVSSWGNSLLTNNSMGNGNDDPQYDGLITIPNTSKQKSTDPIYFVYDGKQVGSSSVTGYPGATYNIEPNELDKLLSKYTIPGGTTVTVNGNKHYINVVNIGSPIYVGDTVLTAEAYYQNPEYFQPSTYPSATNEQPTHDPDDPTYTDDDDAGDYVKNGTDSDGNPKYTLDRYTVNGNLVDNHHRQTYKNDDINAGQYFQAGRLKGILDLDNLNTDNSIYVMPNPFIIGYLTAKSTLMTPKQLIANINKIIKHVQHVKGRVDGTYGHPKYGKDWSYYDYKPKIYSDMSSADVSAADDSATLDSLGILLEAASPSPSHPYDPYENLRSVSSALQTPNSNADYYDSLTHNQYSDVSQIDDRLSGILDTLGGYRNDLANNGQQFYQYRSAAESAAKNQEDAIKQMNVLEMDTMSSADGDIMSSASDDGSSADIDESSASVDNTSASSNSSAMLPYYDEVRGSASNDEANDYNSVAQSYTNSAASDSYNIVRDSTEISHRYRQINVANGIYEQDEVQINSVANSLEDYVPILYSLNSLGANAVGSSLSADYSHDYNAANSALSYLDSLSNAVDTESEKGKDIQNSYSANSDSSDATSYSNDVDKQSGALSDSAVIVGSNLGVQSNLISDAIKHNSADNYTRNQFNNAQTIDTSMMTSDLNSVADSLASADFTGVSAAWVNIHNLHDKVSNAVGAVGEVMMPNLGDDIANYERLTDGGLASSASSSSSAPSQSNNSANNNYQGTFTVTAQDEDAQGNHTSRDIETIPINAKIGTQLTVDPQQYQPEGFHSDKSNHPVNVEVTHQGVQPQNITFYYRINDNGSDSSVNNSQNISAGGTDAAQHSSASSSINAVDGAPIWIDDTPSVNSSSIMNTLSSNTVASQSALPTSMPETNNAQSTSLMSSGSSSSMTASSSSSSSSAGSQSMVSESDHSVDSSSTVQSSSQSTSQSASSQASSSALVSGSAESDTSAGSSSSLSIRHQFLKHYENRAFGVQSSADNEGAKAADRYITGIDVARRGSSANSKDKFYRSGYHAFKKARIRSMHSDSKPTNNHESLISALLLVFSMILGGLVAKDRRYNRNQ